MTTLRFEFRPFIEVVPSKGVYFPTSLESLNQIILPYLQQAKFNFIPLFSSLTPFYYQYDPTNSKIYIWTRSSQSVVPSELSQVLSRIIQTKFPVTSWGLHLIPIRVWIVIPETSTQIEVDLTQIPIQ